MAALRTAAQCILSEQLANEAAPTWSIARFFLGPASVGAVAAAARLVAFVYENPAPNIACVGEPQSIDARLKLIAGVNRWGKVYSYGQYGLVPTVGGMAALVLNDPRGSYAGNRETEVVYAVAQIVLDSKDSSLDTLTWLPLWRWALGGPQGGASTRTRVMAMKAIQAILRRGTLLPGELIKADGLATLLNQLVMGRAPGIPAAEREWYLSEAAATLGAAAAARAAAATNAGGGQVPGTLPVPAATGWPVWTPVAVIGGVGVLLIGGLTVFALRRRAEA